MLKKIFTLVSTVLRYHTAECSRLASLVISALRRLTLIVVKSYPSENGRVQDPYTKSLVKNFRDPFAKEMGKLLETVVEDKVRF